MSEKQNLPSDTDSKVRELAEGLIKHVGYPVDDAWRTAREDVAKSRTLSRGENS